MRSERSTCPLSAQETVDRYLIENRSRLLDIAAFLDRLERTMGPSRKDFRVVAFRRALAALQDESGNRVERIQRILSDRRITLLAPGQDGKDASGAPARPRESEKARG